MDPNQINNQQNVYRDDEIDLFDIFKILWRWRLFIICITLGGLLVGLAFVIWKRDVPVTYTAKVDIQIGKVGNVNIESAGDTYAYLQSDLFNSENKKFKKIKFSFNDFKDLNYPSYLVNKFQLDRLESFQYTTVITLSYSDLDAEQALEVIQKVSNKLHQRHKKIYDDALNKLSLFKPQFEELLKYSNKNLPFFILDSYTYPTRVIEAANVAPNESQNYTATILTIATLSALFMSIVLVFLTESIRNRIKEERKNTNSDVSSKRFQT